MLILTFEATLWLECQLLGWLTLVVVVVVVVVVCLLGE